MVDQPFHPHGLPEGLRYYLLRNGAMVPLIPVDQLPFRLQGISRQLTHRQMSDEGWKFIGETSEPLLTMSVQAPNTTFHSQPVSAKPRYLAPDHHARLQTQSTPVESPRYNRSLSPAPVTETGARQVSRSLPTPRSEPSSSLTDSFASIYQKDAHRIGYLTTYPSGVEPDPSKKEYCTHWIKTGECAFISIGCKYKHEMPTVEKLRDLGFTQGMPRWWKEKSAIAARGQTWMQRRLAQGKGDAETNEIAAPRSFPDPSTFRFRHIEEPKPFHDSIPQDGGSLRKKVATDQQTARPVYSIVTAHGTTRSVIQPQDLLIDLDDMPAPPPSPQLSDNSLASVDSSDTTGPSSQSSASSSSTSPAIGNNDMHKIDDGKHKGMELSHHPRIRRHSQISWSSGSEDGEKAIKLVSKRDPTRTATGRFLAPSKQPGLANSKHANINVQKHKRLAKHYHHNSDRRTTRQKSIRTDATELCAKTEQLRLDTSRKENVRRAQEVPTGL